MAEKLTGKELKDVGTAAKNHNAFKVDRKEAKAVFDRLDRLRSDFESARGEYMADCKSVYESGADTLGIPRKILRKVYGEHVYEQKKQAAEKDLEASEVDAADKLRLALGSYASSPLGKAAVEKAERAEAAAAMGAPAGSA